MRATAAVTIRAPRDAVWRVVADIENAQRNVPAIQKVEVLERPSSGLVGLKWRETRTMFGKEATETMWITDAAAPSHYDTRAESHGAVYTTRVALAEAPEGTRLTMEFRGEPQTFGAKVLGVVFGPLMRSSVRKALQKDLDDIKAAIERR